MATWFSSFAARLLSAPAAAFCAPALLLFNSSTSGTMAPAFAMATWLSAWFEARLLSAPATASFSCALPSFN
eukprot:scaffold45583_cov54-Phaeocystis_antarctica.AAC.2